MRPANSAFNLTMDVNEETGDEHVIVTPTAGVAWVRRFGFGPELAIEGATEGPDRGPGPEDGALAS